jgi:acetyl esterase/lipase
MAGDPDGYVSSRAETMVVPSPGGDVPVRVIRPNEPPTAVFVHCHDGGWAIGSAAGQDASLERISDRTGMTVVSVDYRLAPEHPYPAGLDDCERALRWAIESRERFFGAPKVLVGGESAGANLALCATLRVIQDQPSAVAALALYYGNYDLTGTPSLRNATSANMIHPEVMGWFIDQYVADPALRAEPDVSPLYADLSALPPTALAVGSEDGLVDDTLFLASRLVAASVECELVVAPGGEHAFDLLPLPPFQDAVSRMDAFLSRHARARELPSPGPS